MSDVIKNTINGKPLEFGNTEQIAFVKKRAAALEEYRKKIEDYPIGELVDVYIKISATYEFCCPFCKATLYGEFNPEFKKLVNCSVCDAQFRIMADDDGARVMRHPIYTEGEPSA